jgi:hypothetical protein
MKDWFFITRQTPNGPSPTLATWTSDILQEIERIYGPRDMEFTLLGVEFHDGGPCIWYPTAGLKHIVIRLSCSAADDLSRAIYQLAHECVHLLAPSGGARASVLEEGLATWFSADYVKRKLDVPFSAGNENYTRAAQELEKLFEIRQDAVKALRSACPSFHEMSVETFEQAGLSNVPTALRDNLLTPFNEYRPN